MKICPNCKKINSDNSKFCCDCGTKLGEPQANPANSSTICQYCGATLDPSNPFCPECKRRVRPDTDDEWNARHRQEVRDARKFRRMNKDTYNDGAINNGFIAFILPMFFSLIGFIIMLRYGGTRARKIATISFIIFLTIEILYTIFAVLVNTGVIKISTVEETMMLFNLFIR